MAKKKKKTDLDRILDGTYQSPLERNSNKITPTTNKTTTISNKKQSDLDQVLNGTYTPKYLGKKTSGKSNVIPTSKRNDKWLQTPDNFKDGYDMWDVSKTILGTTADIGLGIGKGIFNIGEGIGDTITYGEAQVFDWLGKDEFADNLRAEAQRSLANDWLNPVEDVIAKNSVIGDKGDSLAEGLGYVAGLVATGGTASGLALKTGKSLNQAGKIATAITSGTTFLSSMGSSMGEAYEGKATDGQAWAYGTIGGLAEAGTELMFGGLGKAVNVAGLSHGISSLDDQVAKKVSSLFKSTLSKNLAEYGIKAGAEGFEEVASGILQALGQKLTYSKKEDLLKLLDDQDLLEQFIVGAVVSGIAQTPSLIKTTKAGESFVKTDEQLNEEAKKVPYQYQIREQDSDVKKATLESSKGIMNDTKESRELMDALVSMAEDRQVPYKVTTTERLLNSNYVDEVTKKKIKDSYDPKTKKYTLNMDGVYEIENNGKREILVNVESSKYLEQILVHETAHDFKNGDVIRYKNLQDATIEYATETGELKSIEEEVRRKYEGQNEDVIKEEITSRLLEDYVGNEGFIKSLTSKQPKIVKDIIDKIKYLYKKFTAGSEQAKKLLDLQRKVEKAYKEAYSEQVSDTQAKVNKAVRDKIGDKRVIIPEVKKEAVDTQEKAEIKQETKKKSKPKKEVILPTKQDIDNDKGISKIKDKYDKSVKVDGSKRSIVLNNGEKLSGTYKLLEAGSVTPSHNSKNFAKSDNFPLTDKGTTINDRDYENDKTAQQLVKEKAQNYDGRAFNDNGVIVTKDGIVVSGNDRTMAGEIASRNNTDKAYIEYLKENAEQFGFTKEQIANMKHPRVVFELDENVEYNTKTYAKFNKDSKKTKSVSEKAKEIGKTIEDNTIVDIANVFDDYETIDQVYNSPKASKDLLDLMLKKGLIDNNEISQMYDGTKFTGAGKDFIEATIIGSVIKEDNVKYFRNNNNLKFKLMKSAPAMIQNKTLGEYSIIDEINNAMAVYKDAQQSNMTIEQYNNQVDLFGDTDVDLVTKKIAEILEKKGYKELRNFLDKYNELALSPARGQVDLFTGEIKTKEEVLNESLNINEDNEIERRYSLNTTTDNKGRQLTLEQQEYFKDSKIRDEEGNLLTLYHTTDADFNEFDVNKFGLNTGGKIKGIYLTDKVLGNYGDKVIESYVNITNPVTIDSKNITKEQFAELLKGKVSESNIEGAWRYYQNANDLNILYAIQEQYRRNRNYQNNQEFYDNVKRITGYDGLIYSGQQYYANDMVSYVAFNSNQVKKVDNTNPTDNPDTRYSLSEDNKGRTLAKGQIEYFKDSKARDENGNLLVLYHGTYTDEMFTIFEPKKGFNVDAIYLTPDLNVSSFFGNGSSIRNFDKTLIPRINEAKTTNDLIKIFSDDLNNKVEIKKSYTDENGDYYRLETYDGNSTSPLGYKTGENTYSYKNFNGEVKETNIFNKLKEKALEEAYQNQIYASNYEVYANIVNPLIINANGKPFYQIEFEGKTTNTETISSIAKERGYDGVIVKNVLETSYEDQLTDDYIVFNSNQIKDVKNQNPTDNPDFRYSLSEEKK